jgi:hypothetical protein
MTERNEEPLTDADRGLPEDPWQRLEVVAKQLAVVADRLAQVADTARRTRHLAIGLTVSIVLDVALTVVVTLLTVSALSQGTTLHASQLAACAIGNQNKLEQQQLWGYLFNLTGGPKTSEEKQFLTFVDKTFAPVNCAQVYK